jgi:VWFA-related protein
MIISRSTALHLTFLNVLLIGLVSAQQLHAQVKTPPGDDVIRVKTELVQTDVTVVDKRGRFVSGLRGEDFELRVDAKPQSVSFFEEVTAGSADEEKQLAAARKGDKAALAKITPDPAIDHGRVVFFFVDDVHLTSEGLTRARTVITHFVENKMTAKDRVAVISTSGQIGFLQQLTDNKAVLREAISRLNSKFNPETTASQVPISEVDATLVSNHGDRGLFAYLVEATMKEFQTNALNAYTIVTNRVRQINAQSKIAEINSLSRLENFVRSTAPLPGRKLLFFISDGFVVDTKRSNGSDVMRRVINEAARVGVVIYSLGTRPNILGPGIDVSTNAYPDFSPRTAGRSLAESKLPQEPLETLAEETGGRSYLNASALDDGVGEALNESSAYYLLAWRPDSETQRSGKSRLKVVVKDHPDLRVRMRQHFFDFRENTKSEATARTPRTPADELTMALRSLYPRRELPISVAASFTNTAEKGTLLNASMQIDGASLSFGEREQAIVDVLGFAIDDRGRFASFKQKLDIPRAVGRFIKWNQALSLPPGLYQVRVAVRDRQTGRTGSAMTWLEIPLH